MAPIPEKYLRAMNDDFTLLSDGLHSAGLDVNHARVHADEWHTETLQLRCIARIEDRYCRCFCKTVALDKAELELVKQPFGDSLRHG